MTTITAQRAGDILTGLGWPSTLDLSKRLSLFQAGYVGPDLAHPYHLAVDGVLGPATSAALQQSAADHLASPHFAWRDFSCKGPSHSPGCPRIWPARGLLLALEALRANAYPMGLRVVSGCRCGAHNAEAGGKPGSQHLLGRAADVPPIWPAARVAQLGLFGGIGYSPTSGKVCHVDVRAVPVQPFADGT